MALKPPNFLVVLLVSFLPLIAITLGIEGYGLHRFGEAGGEMGRLKIPIERIIRYEGFYALATVLIILAGSGLLKSIADSLGVKSSYSVTFVLMVCGFMPIFLLRIADGLPRINTWICWAVGAAVAVRILYHGVALWLKPEQTKGFGLFIVSVVYTFVLSALVHFAAVQVLHGKLLRNIYPDGSGLPFKINT